MKIEEHAHSVVNGFKKSLDKEQKQLLTEQDYENLQMLVEAAIGSTAELALHDVAKEMEELAKKTRNRARSLETLES